MTTEQKLEVITAISAMRRGATPILQELKTTRATISRDLANISGATVTSYSIVRETIIIKYYLP